MKFRYNANLFIVVAALLGVGTAFFAPLQVIALSGSVSQIFVKLLRLISMPIIFFSIVATLTGIRDQREAWDIGQKVMKYTLLTTLLAASIALGYFLLLSPTYAGVQYEGELPKAHWTKMLDIVPDNALAPFLEGNVMGVLFLALLLSVGTLTLPDPQRETLHQLFRALFGAVMKITGYIVQLLPLAIWAFVTEFVLEMQRTALEGLVIYVVCVLLANVTQAIVVLPALLRSKRIPVIASFKAMMPALTLAFFARSTSAALPVTMQQAEGPLGVSKRTSRFSLPLCATINMNACAAFILITVLYVSTSHGYVFTAWELIAWIFIATLGAVGNAAVPMGCYFVSSAFLAAMGMPLNILGVILPIYSLIDMLESAINVWSDSVVTALVDAELSDVEPAA